MKPEYIVYGLYLLVGLFAIGQAIRGGRRHFGRSLLNLIATIASAAISAVILHTVVSGLDESMTNQLVSALASREETKSLANGLQSLKTSLPDVYELLIGLPVSLVAPLVFVILYWLIGTPMWILYIVLAALLFPRRPRDEYSPLSKLLGALLGAANGLAVAFIYILPLAGYLTISGGVMDTLAPAFEGNATFTQVQNAYDEYKEPIENHPVVDIVWSCGEDLFDYITVVSYDYQDNTYKVSLQTESVLYAQIITDAKPLFRVPVKDYTTTQTDAIKRIASDIESSNSLKIVISGLLSGACHAWDEGEPFLSVVQAPVSSDATVQSLLDSAIDTLKNTTPETVGNDLCAVADMIGVMVEHDIFNVINTPDGLMNMLSDEDFISDFMGAIEQSETLRTFMVDATKVGVQTVMKEKISQDNYNQAVNTLSTEAATVLNDLAQYDTKEAQVEAMTDMVEDVMEQYNVTQGKAILPYVAEFVIDEFADQLATGEVTAEDVANYLGLLQTEPVS